MTRFRALQSYGLIVMVAAMTSCFFPGSRSLAENPHILLETSMGDIEVELFEKEAPKTVENFLKYTKKGHYDNTIFHRVIKDFVVQGGGFDESMKQKGVDAPIKNEAKNGLKNDKYTLSMARTNQPDSATSQFYINLVNNSMLNRDNPRSDGFGYCVFGKVVKGEEIVDKMGLVKTTSKGPHRDVPADAIILKKATILEPAKIESGKQPDGK